MTLTTATATTGKARWAQAWRANPAGLDLTLDAIILAVAAALCMALLFQGGLEALLGAGIGVALTRRARNQSAVSGALAGLWVGAVFAGLFHSALTVMLQALF